MNVSIFGRKLRILCKYGHTTFCVAGQARHNGAARVPRVVWAAGVYLQTWELCVCVRTNQADEHDSVVCKVSMRAGDPWGWQSQSIQSASPHVIGTIYGLDDRLKRWGWGWGKVL
jgi:hypothetical protein